MSEPSSAPRRQTWKGMIIYVIVAVILAALSWLTVGIGWGLLLLVAFWISANVVFWFKRHPPPPSAFRGGRKD